MPGISRRLMQLDRPAGREGGTLRLTLIKARVSSEFAKRASPFYLILELETWPPASLAALSRHRKPTSA